MTFQAKDYAVRGDLENAVKKEVGIDVEKNEAGGHEIHGTREELKKLQLSDLTTVWGLKCVITDTPTVSPKPSSAKPERGERKPFGIVGKTEIK